MPPHSRNHLTPTADETPAARAASSLEHPAAIARQNGRRSDRCSTGGRPGDLIFARSARSARLFPVRIATSYQDVLRRWVESAQFTSEDFTALLKDNGITISMDGKGCWRDNVFVERLWKSIKYEEVYLHAYDSVSAARAGIGRYIGFYNERRPHRSLDGATPDSVYFKSLPVPLAA
jgi:putative transposase